MAAMTAAHGTRGRLSFVRQAPRGSATHADLLFSTKNPLYSSLSVQQRPKYQVSLVIEKKRDSRGLGVTEGLSL